MDQPILARISIGIYTHGDIDFIYDFNTLKSFKTEMIDGIVNFEKDSKFEYNGNQYKVTDIQTLFYDQLQRKNLHQAGANLYSSNERQDFNVEIIYYVKKLTSL